MNTIGGVVAGARNVISANGIVGAADLGDGVEIDSSTGTGNLVQGNYIGVGANGTATPAPDGSNPLRNAGYGVNIFMAATRNTIGGTATTAGNIIAGNLTSGVGIHDAGTTANLVQGNTIGLDLNRNALANNGDGGVTIFNGATSNTIGGAGGVVGMGLGNVISGNSGDGVSIYGAGTTANTIVGNNIGVDSTGLLNRANAGQAGVEIYNGATSNTIGGGAGLGDIISGNTGDDVYLHDQKTSTNLIEGNTIGLDSGGATLANAVNGVEIATGATSNTIGGAGALGNVISGNTSDGVSIHSPGTTANSVVDNDIGTNRAGTLAVANGMDGVIIAGGASGNTIGGSQASSGNLISGNTLAGVEVSGAGTSNNLVAANFIGTNFNGSQALADGGDGVKIDGAATSDTIGGTTNGARNLISGNTGNGVTITDAMTSDNEVEGNFIGTDASGTIPLANADGVEVIGGASGNSIGGTESGAGNLVSGNNFDGVNFTGQGTTGNNLEGNFIGTDTTGTVALANNFGVSVFDASGNDIGGTEPGAGNLISGNRFVGVEIIGNVVTGNPTSSNNIEGNRIGTDLTGSFAVGNGIGVMISAGASNNDIGGTEVGAGNLISGNNGTGSLIGGVGVVITDAGTTMDNVEGNFIGTDATGTNALPNVAGVLIFGGASGNDVGGTEAGANNVISGNDIAGGTIGGVGVAIEGPGTTMDNVEGNRIGTDAAGTAALGNLAGVWVFGGASNNDIGGTEAGAGNLISGNLGDGVAIYNLGDGNDSSQDNVEGNFIGTDATGTVALGNGMNGVEVFGGATDNDIGGSEAGARDVISANGLYGVSIHDVGTARDNVEGDYIGTDVNGSAALPNLIGVAVAGGASGNDVGGTASGAGDVISGNITAGIAFSGAGTLGNMVEGDYIGTNAAGTSALGNAGNGVIIDTGATANEVGGTDPRASNIISGNGAWGVGIYGSGSTINKVDGNKIGVAAGGTSALGNVAGGVEVAGSSANNTIGGSEAGAGNVISGNKGDGIGIHDSGTMGNAVEGNRIGTDSTGVAPVGNGANGVEVYSGATNNTIGGTEAGASNVISDNGLFNSGSANLDNGISIHDSGTTGDNVEGNLIGTNVTGSTGMGNLGSGVRIYGGASMDEVGGTASGARDVISSNGTDGVTLSDANTTGNTVDGDYIGTDSTGTVAVGNNGNGVSIVNGSSSNTIGGTVSAALDVISANMGSGVLIRDANTDANQVEGDDIGSDVTGTMSLANSGDGVTIIAAASNNTIGGTASGAGDVIAFNKGNGVVVGSNTSDQATGDGILGNSIFANAKLGIDLADDGVTPNSPGGPNSGPNDLQNYPVLTTATFYPNRIIVEGTLNSTPNTTFQIEFFANSTFDPSGYGQGQVELGSIPVTTDGDGNASFSATFMISISGGQVVSATATDPGNNTSEFSMDLAVVPPPPSPSAIGVPASRSRLASPPMLTASPHLLDAAAIFPLPAVAFDESTLTDLAADLIRSRQRQARQAT